MSNTVYTKGAVAMACFMTATVMGLGTFIAVLEAYTRGKVDGMFTMRCIEANGVVMDNKCVQVLHMIGETR